MIFCDKLKTSFDDDPKVIIIDQDSHQCDALEDRVENDDVSYKE